MSESGLHEPREKYQLAVFRLTYDNYQHRQKNLKDSSFFWVFGEAKKIKNGQIFSSSSLAGYL